MSCMKINLMQNYHNAFSVLRNRVHFITYEIVSNWHSKTYELVTLEDKLTIG